jgi:O-antigen/teichoic acid export membrane protein
MATQDSVQQKMAKGAAWMVLFKLVERSIGLVSTLILARLLMPTDFGIVAMAMSFIFMAELLTAFGFDIALIQNQQASRAHYDTAWTGNLLLGLAICVLMVALAAPIAEFYRKPEVFWVVMAVSLGPLIGGFENIGVVTFRKELNFRREFWYQLSRKAIGFLVVIPLAFILRSYWALVAGILVSRLASTVISYLMHPFRPRFSLEKLRELFGFSRWLLFNNMVTFFKERSSDFFIGRLLGPAPLGIYNLSYELANLPSTELSAPINRALLPGFAKLATPEEVAAAYRNALGMLALVALPAAFGIFAVAPYLVPVVLGTKWLEATPLIEVLAFNGALLLIHSSMCGVLIGRGFPERVTITNALYVGMLLVLLAAFAYRFGVVGAAYAALLTSILSTPIYLHQMKRCLGVRSGVFLRAIVRPLLAAALMAAAVRVALPAASPHTAFVTLVTWLAAGVALGVVSYVAVIAVSWLAAGRPAGAESVVYERVRARLVGWLGAKRLRRSPKAM